MVGGLTLAFYKNHHPTDRFCSHYINTYAETPHPSNHKTPNQNEPCSLPKTHPSPLPPLFSRPHTPQHQPHDRGQKDQRPSNQRDNQNRLIMAPPRRSLGIRIRRAEFPLLDLGPVCDGGDVVRGASTGITSRGYSLVDGCGVGEDLGPRCVI